MAKLTASYGFFYLFQSRKSPHLLSAQTRAEHFHALLGQNCQARNPRQTQRKWPSHSTVVLERPVLQILWTCQKGNHFPSFRTEKSKKKKTLRKALLWGKVASSSFPCSFAFGCFETKLPGCILKRWIPRAPKKLIK